ALTASDAPEWCPVLMLALASKLVPRDAEQEQLDAAAREIMDYFSGEPYNMPPVERDTELGWDRDTLKSCIREVLATERGETTSSESDPMSVVIECVADRGDDEWVLVGELGRMSGAVVDDPEDPNRARLDAGAFGAALRRAPWSLPDVAFKRTSSGNAVRVGELRRAAG